MTEKIKALLFEPGEKPKDIEIENNLEAFRRAVNGCIETRSLLNNVVLITNEEGLNHRMRPSVMALIPTINEFGSKKYRYFTLVGSVVAAGVQGEDFRSLTKPERDFVMEYIWPI